MECTGCSLLRYFLVPLSKAYTWTRRLPCTIQLDILVTVSSWCRLAQVDTYSTNKARLAEKWILLDIPGNLECHHSEELLGMFPACTCSFFLI